MDKRIFCYLIFIILICVGALSSFIYNTNSIRDNKDYCDYLRDMECNNDLTCSEQYLHEYDKHSCHMTIPVSLLIHISLTIWGIIFMSICFHYVVMWGEDYE